MKSYLYLVLLVLLLIGSIILFKHKKLVGVPLITLRHPRTFAGTTGISGMKPENAAYHAPTSRRTPASRQTPANRETPPADVNSG
jgi:hypothetical protein